MQLLMCIKHQSGQVARRCVGALAGLIIATVDAAGLTLPGIRSPIRCFRASGLRGSRAGHYDVRYMVGNVTSYELVGLDEGRNYHFAVTAYDVFYGESEFSNDVGTTIPYRPPVVAFEASTTTGTAPLALNFVATIQGAVTATSGALATVQRAPRRLRPTCTRRQASTA